MTASDPERAVPPGASSSSRKGEVAEARAVEGPGRGQAGHAAAEDGDGHVLPGLGHGTEAVADAVAPRVGASYDRARGPGWAGTPAGGQARTGDPGRAGQATEEIAPRELHVTAILRAAGGPRLDRPEGRE